LGETINARLPLAVLEARYSAEVITLRGLASRLPPDLELSFFQIQISIFDYLFTFSQTYFLFEYLNVFQSLCNRMGVL